MAPESIAANKYRVSINIYIISIISFSLISATTFFFNTIYFSQAIASLGLTVFSLVLLLTTKNYKLPVYITVLLSVFIHLLGYLTNSFANNQGDIYWIIVLCLFTFYILGKNWSLLYLVVNIGSMIIVKLLTINKIINIPAQALEPSIVAQVNYVLNLLACSVFLLYLINNILKEFDQSQKDLLNTNEILSAQDQEKTAMLKEIHHRVKNNLQVIISLLRLQLFQIDQSDPVSGPFQDSINRISTMALIHEKMYKGEKINNLSVEEYVDDLANDLVRTYATSTKVTVKIESNVDHLSMNNLVPFSLILNELITNSIQHGFKNHEKGNIEVLLKQTPIGFDLIYRDSGEWIDNGGQESFGLELIDTLNGHFDGVYRKSTSAAGTEYVFNFKIF